MVVQDALESLRARHGVRLVTTGEEGFGVDALPGGVYGFTYAPAAHNSPLFRERKHQNFEVHKLEDGAVLLLGYVTAEIAARLEGECGGLKLRLLPEPREDAPMLVAIPTWRIGRHKEHSQRDGNGLELEMQSLEIQ